MKKIFGALFAALLLLTLLLPARAVAAAAPAEAEKQEYIETLSGDEAEREKAEQAIARGQTILVASTFGILALLAFTAIRRTRN